MKIVFLILLAATFAFSPAATASTGENVFVGSWDVIITAPGQDLAGTLLIEKDGERFKGSLTTEHGEAPLKNFTMKESSFVADMTANVQGQSFEGTMSGNLADGKLSGEINLSGLGAIPYAGKKK